MRKWGFRRCEDICWIKTNKTNPGNTKYLEPNSVLQHTKEHCLMGIKGTVRRSTDGDFIHANVDIDLIITEEVSLMSIKGTFCRSTDGDFIHDNVDMDLIITEEVSKALPYEYKGHSPQEY